MSVWLELLVYSNAPLAVPAERGEGIAVQLLDAPVRPGPEVVFPNEAGELAQRVRTASHTLAVSLREPDGDLDGALGRVATVLEEVAVRAAADRLATTPGDPILLDVVDVFCLDGRPMDQAIERLRSGATHDRLWIRARPAAGDRFDVETYGLRRLGQRELLVPTVAQGQLPLVSRFVNQLASHLAAPGVSLSPGDATSFGWVDVRMRAAEDLAGYPDQPWMCAPRFVREAVASLGSGAEQELPGLLVVFEPEDGDPNAQLVPGASRALGLAEQLVASAHQCGITRGIDVPRGEQTAIVCTRVKEGPPVEARRIPPDERCSSGWVALCRHPDHDHEPAAGFETVSLKQLVGWIPRLFPMLAAPPGTGLTVGEDDELTIEPPDEADG